MFLQSLRQVDATIYTIGMGSNVERSVLEQVSAESGGESFFPTAVEESPGRLPASHRASAATVCGDLHFDQYEEDGKWRKVQIQTADHFRVKSRGGYQAPRTDRAVSQK